MCCDKALELMSLYYDKELDRAGEELLFAHLAECEYCHEAFEAMGEMLAQCKEIPLMVLPEGYHEELMQKLKKESAMTPISFFDNKDNENATITIDRANKDNFNKEKFNKEKFKWSHFQKYTSVAAALLILVAVGVGISSFGGNSIPTQNNPSAGQGREMDSISMEKSTMSTAEAPMPEASAERIMYDEAMVAEEGFIESSADTGGADLENLMPKQERKQIKNYSATIQVSSFDDTIASIKQITSENNGYIENYSSHISRDSFEYKDGQITIRVPQDKYGLALQKISSLGIIENESETTEDITAQYVDTQTRLTVKRTEQERVLELLKKSDNIEDIIKLEERLGVINTEIEGYESTVRDWDRQVEYCKMDFYIMQNRDNKIQPTDSNFSQKIKNSLIGSVNAFVVFCQNLVLGIAYDFVPLTLVAIAGFGIIIYIKKRKKKKKEE